MTRTGWTRTGRTDTGRTGAGRAGGADHGPGLGPDLDVAGLIRRVRRIADLSQRDLARLLGVCPASVGHWETGRRVPDLSAFEALLRLAGLRLLVVTDAPLAEAAGGAVAGAIATDANATDANATDAPASTTWVPVDARGGVLPMRTDGVRDGGGRRYPAHLDPEPLHQIWRPRWDRPELNLQCHRRRLRDAERSAVGLAGGAADHLTPEELAATLARWRAERRARGRQWLPPRPPATPESLEAEQCTCPLDCEEIDGPCPDDCPCGCERPPFGGSERR